MAKNSIDTLNAPRTRATTALVQVVHQREEELEAQRRIRLLADGLMLASGIHPHSQNLVIWFGTQEAHNNREALIHWVAETLASTQTTPENADPHDLRLCLALKLDSLMEICS